MRSFRSTVRRYEICHQPEMSKEANKNADYPVSVLRDAMEAVGLTGEDVSGKKVVESVFVCDSDQKSILYMGESESCTQDQESSGLFSDHEVQSQSPLADEPVCIPGRTYCGSTLLSEESK